jgi:flagellar basal-body rod modification protein FlgD
MSTTSSVSSTKTANGTTIVPLNSTSDSLGKNAFLQILTTEMSNQDPTQQTDSTAYVAQLAQFSSLEQMQNLNNSVTFSNASSLIGKTVTVSDTDANNNPYSGSVAGVSKNGDTISMTLNITSNGTTTQKQFDYSNITKIAATTATTATTTATTSS